MSERQRANRTGTARYADASRALLRDTILRATDELVAEKGWAAVTMAQVGSRAGVSRQTVYNEVGSRDALAQAYAVWAGDQMLDEVERCLAAHRDDLAGALRAALQLFLEVADEHPLVRAIRAATGTDDLLGLVARAGGGVVVEAATARLGSIVTATWPDLAPADVGLVCELLVRLAISHVILPTTTPAAAADHAARALAPLLATVEHRTP